MLDTVDHKFIVYTGNFAFKAGDFTFLPRVALQSAFLGVVILSVHLSHTCFLTTRKNVL